MGTVGKRERGGEGAESEKQMFQLEFGFASK